MIKENFTSAKPSFRSLLLTFFIYEKKLFLQKYSTHKMEHYRCYPLLFIRVRFYFFYKIYFVNKLNWKFIAIFANL